MKFHNLSSYLAPNIEICRVVAEQGYKNSNQEYIEDEKDPLDWY